MLEGSAEAGLRVGERRSISLARLEQPNGAALAAQGCAGKYLCRRLRNPQLLPLPLSPSALLRRITRWHRADIKVITNIY